MGKLYELLAVETALKDAYQKILAEAKKTFGKPALFIGHLKKLEMFAEDDKAADGVTERQERETTVGDKLRYIRGPIVDYYDCIYQKELANKEAIADIVISEKDGQETVIAENIPATYLLGMENRLKYFRNVLESIPTLDKGIKWKPDTQEGKGVYVTEHPKETFKTAKFPNSAIIAPATKEHKAQVETWNDVKNVGRYIEDFSSGMITSGMKSEILGRFDTLLNAIHKARVRANSVEASNSKIADKMMDYILGDV